MKQSRINFDSHPITMDDLTKIEAQITSVACCKQAAMGVLYSIPSKKYEDIYHPWDDDDCPECVTVR